MSKIMNIRQLRAAAVLTLLVFFLSGCKSEEPKKAESSKTPESVSTTAPEPESTPTPEHASLSPQYELVELEYFDYDSAKAAIEEEVGNLAQEWYERYRDDVLDECGDEWESMGIIPKDADTFDFNLWQSQHVFSDGSCYLMGYLDMYNLVEFDRTANNYEDYAFHYYFPFSAKLGDDAAVEVKLIEEGITGGNRYCVCNSGYGYLIFSYSFGGGETEHRYFDVIINKNNDKVTTVSYSGPAGLSYPVNEDYYIFMNDFDGSIEKVFEISTGEEIPEDASYPEDNFGKYDPDGKIQGKYMYVSPVLKSGFVLVSEDGISYDLADSDYNVLASNVVSNADGYMSVCLGADADVFLVEYAEHYGYPPAYIVKESTR